jgi:hypothetical protein
MKREREIKKLSHLQKLDLTREFQGAKISKCVL